MNLDSISQELDRLYQFEISEYISRCDELKKAGYKIYRNSEGIHKVAVGGQQSRKEQAQYSAENSVINNKKKDNVFKRAKNRIKRGIQNFRSFVGFIRFMYNTYKNSRR